MARSQRIELTVSLQEAFPRILILELARRTGIVIRMREFDPVVFFWALMKTIIGGLGDAAACVKREYERLSGKSMDNRSFYDRMGDQRMVAFLQACFEHATDNVFPEGSRAEVLRRFSQVLIQDSSIIRLRDKLAGRWPGVSTPAAAKINVIVNAGGGKPGRVQTAKGTKAEVKFRMINRNLAGTLTITDLGYFDYPDFARIEKNDGLFLSRLKENADPTIVASNLAHRGQALDLAGKRLRDVLPLLTRAELDVTVEIEVDLRGQPGRPSAGGYRSQKFRWRVVGLRNEETGEYHLYITNIPREWLSVEEIALAYSQRWEVELLFKELKGCFDLGAWKVTREATMLVQTYAVLVAWALSRRLRADLLGPKQMASPRAATLAAPVLRFARVLRHYIGDLIGRMLAGRRCPADLVGTLRAAARDPNRKRVALTARETLSFRKPALAGA